MRGHIAQYYPTVFNPNGVKMAHIIFHIMVHIIYNIFLVICFAEIAKLHHRIKCVNITEKILEKNFSFPCSTIIRQIVMPFLYGPILPQRGHFILGLWWATGPTLPRYWPDFTPNYGVMMSCWIFSFLFELIIVNRNPF